MGAGHTSVSDSSLPSGAQSTSYTYDALGNLKLVVTPTQTITYQLDGLNRRASKSVGGVLLARYLYEDQYRVGAVIDGTGHLSKHFGYGSKTNVPDFMVLKSTGQKFKIISDLNGSVRLVVDTATGSIAQQMDYDEFGRVINDTNPGFQPFGFAGGLYDPETGFTHFGARDYDASVGRWLQKDPILFAGEDSNLYGYVLNDPVNFIDPTGLLRANKPAPATVMPDGPNGAAAACFEACVGGDLLVTGGQEKSGHSKNSKHYSNNACDFASSENGNPTLSDPAKNRQCAKSCGYTNGQYETFPNNPNRNHWHFQIGPGNGVPSL